jgi:hypothetical protein
LQDGGAVEQIVRVAFRENFEYDDIKGNAANEGYKNDGYSDFEKLMHIFRKLLTVNDLQDIKVLAGCPLKRDNSCKKYAYLYGKTMILPVTP